MKLQIESRVLGDLVINHVLPAAKRYQTMLLENVMHVKQVFPEAEVASLNEQDYIIIRRIEDHASAIIAGVEQMNKLRAKANHIDNTSSADEAMIDEIEQSLDVLDGRQRKIICEIYGIGSHAKTMAEIAEEMGLKRERVRQIRDKAVRKLCKEHLALKGMLRN